MQQLHLTIDAGILLLVHLFIGDLIVVVVKYRYATKGKLMSMAAT